MTTSGAMNAILNIPGLRGQTAASTANSSSVVERTRENGIWLSQVLFGGSVDANQTGTGERGRARRVSFRELTVIKVIDETTSAFFTAMCTGRRFQEGSLSILRPYGDGRDVEYFKYNMTDVMVAAQNYNGAPGNDGTTVAMNEEIKLTFSSIQVAFAGDDWSPTGLGSTFQSIIWDVNEHRAR